MELASRGSNAKRGYGRNLPTDPRPTLNAIAQSLAHAMEKSGVRAVVSGQARPFGFGSAFRKDKWFATVPNYQQPGTSDLAPEPGILLERPTRKTSRPAESPDGTLNPTRTWPQTSRWLSQSICSGQEGCRYEPGDLPAGRRIRGGCEQMWRGHSAELFRAFMEANPGVMFRDHSFRCVKEIEPHHRCYTREHHQLHGRPIDHAQLCRLPDGSRFIISQTYCGDQLCPECLDNIATWQAELPHLRWVTAGRERSWYFPNNANLLLLGPQETLDSLHLNYAVPTESRPDGCVRYPTHL